MNSNYYAAVQFPDEYANLTELPLQLNLTIRFPSEMRIRVYGDYESKVETWMTDEMYPQNTEFALGDLGGLPQANYIGEGFATLQLAVALNYISILKKDNNSIILDNLKNYTFRRFSEREFQNDSFHNYKLIAVSTIYYLMNFAAFLYSTTVLANEMRKTKYLEFAGFDEKQPYAILMMIPSTFCFFISYIFMNTLLADPFGERKKWYFMFTKSFWKPNKYSKLKESYIGDKLLYPDENMTSRRVGAFTINLQKIYNGQNVVKGITIQFFVNEICVLFGSSVSGIKTIIGMLAGTIKPTSGSAEISGHNIITEIISARKSISICPEPIEFIFEHLTIQENIKFFSMMKGVNKHHLNEEIVKYLPYIKCSQYVDVYANQLSIGNKVKLAIIAALCGNSKVIIIEQPSKGVDSLARKEIWNMLRHEKQFRTIIVSTNCIEEADAIGDNIVIIIDGELRTSGSPFSLRKQFGDGYNLTFIKKEHCRISKITYLLKSFIPSIGSPIEIGSELTYYLPIQYSKTFKHIFKEIERLTLPDQLGVEGFGVQLPSLEDLFMKMEPKEPIERKRVSMSTLDRYNRQYYTGCTLINSQIMATYSRKFLYMKRHWKSFVCFFIVTCICNLLLYSKIIKRHERLPPLKFDWNLFDQRNILFVADNQGFLGKIINSTKQYNTLKYQNQPFLRHINVSRVGLDDILLRSKLSELFNLYIGGVVIEKNTIEITYNPYFLHSAPNIISFLANSIAKSYISPESQITVYNDPGSYTIKTQMYMSKDRHLLIVFVFHIFYMLIISLFAFMPAKERLIGLKLQQLKSGLSALIYWIVHLHIDVSVFMIVAIVPTVSIIFIGRVLGTQHMVECITLYLIIFLAGTSSLACLYSLTKILNNGAMCATIFNCVWFTTGPLLLFLMVNSRSNNAAYGIWCKFFDCFVWFPSYASSSALYKTIRLINSRKFCNLVCSLRGTELKGCTVESLCREHFQSDYCCAYNKHFWFIEEGILYEITTMLINSVIVISFLILSDSPSCRSISEFRPPVLKDYKDADVKREENFAHFANKSPNNIVVLNATKEYKNGKKIALNDVSFILNAGECFCLLGNSGSGKSTLLKALSAVKDLTSGKAYINGLNINKHYATVQKDVAYCPFEIFLLEEFTVYEHLTLFLNIYGLPRNKIKEFITYFSEFTEITEYLSLKVKVLNEGLKKKLCVAIMLLHCRKLILLDEPTYTIDIKERREIWELIHLLYESQRTIIIASNNATECEALCSRLAIMVNGEFSCIGSVQKLKNNFFKGLALIIRMKQTKYDFKFYSATSLENTSFSTEESQESVKVVSEDISKVLKTLKLHFSNVLIS
ncbi:ABCA3 family protein [Megaselia abdita]